MKLYERNGVFVLEPLTSDQARQLSAMAVVGGSLLALVPAVMETAGEPGPEPAVLDLAALLSRLAAAGNLVSVTPTVVIAVNALDVPPGVELRPLDTP